MREGDKAWANIDAALAPVHIFAKTLIGLPVGRAADLAHQHGYEVAIDCKALDISLNRIRIERDAENVVRVATAG